MSRQQPLSIYSICQQLGVLLFEDGMPSHCGQTLHHTILLLRYSELQRQEHLFQNNLLYTNDFCSYFSYAIIEDHC